MCWLLGAAAAAAGAADPSMTLQKKRLPAPCYWRATATAAAAVPTKTRPSRTGKHHGPEGRTESKICVSRGRNVPFWNLLQKACYTFLEAGCWLAASCYTASAAAYWCLLLPAAACCCLRLPAACCLLLPAAACCWCCCWWLLLLLVAAAAAAVVLLLCCCNQTASKARNSCCCCCCCAHKDTALPDGETPWPWRTNGVQNRRFPGAGTSLLKSPRKSLLDVSWCWLLGAAAAAAAAAVAAAVPTETRPSRRGNTMAPGALPGSAAPAAVVVRNKSQKYYSLARSPLRLPGSADMRW